MEQAGKRHRHHLGHLHQCRAVLPAHQARHGIQHELRHLRCWSDRAVQYELVVGCCEEVSLGFLSPAFKQQMFAGAE